MRVTTHPTPSYIISVPAGDDVTAVELKESFLARGYLVPVFFFPAVLGTSRCCG